MSEPIKSSHLRAEPMIPPQEDAMDLDAPPAATEQAAKRTFEQMQAPGPSVGEPLQKRARIEPPERGDSEWEDMQSKFQGIEVTVEGPNPLRFKIPKFALMAISPVFKAQFTHEMADTRAATMSWGSIHPEAAKYVRQFALKKVKLDSGLTLTELKGRFPEEFDAIFRDIVDFSDKYAIPKLWKECAQFLTEELKSDMEKKIPHYFQWAAFTTGPLLKLFGEALVESSKTDSCAKIWPILLELYEGDYQECSPEQKAACQDFLQDCFEKITKGMKTLDWNSELDDFCACFVGLFPSFEFSASLLQHIGTISPFNIGLAPPPGRNPTVQIVYLFICAACDRLFALPNLPVQGILRQYYLLTQVRLADSPSRLEKLNQIIAEYPENIFAFRSRAWFHYSAKNYAEALASLNRIIQLKPGHVDALKLRAQIHFYTSDFEAAIKAYEEIIKRGNEDEFVLVNIVECYLQEMRFTDAWRILNRALEMYPQSLKVIARRAHCYSVQDNFEDAWKEAEKVLRLDKNNYEALKVQANCNKEKGQFEAALEIYARIPPSHADMLRGKAVCYLGLGNLQEAKVNLDKALKLAPDNAIGIALLGEWHLKSGDIASAKEALAKALERAERLSKLQRSVLLEMCAKLQEQLDQTKR